ncbi:iron-siderophore ABC transporter substrate-binding protein [Nocardiopsis sp. NPDC058631]|uniref:iron-siderophore ABC transporter substrate-binding protein n=1 Tax=Nocardiopsis sp. NPDC058631 TaxID=3346566 RepID=UPI0036546783
MRSHRFTALTAAAATVLTLAACGAQPEEEEAAAEGGSGEYPIVIEHALGTTTIESQPERVAAVNWANHEVPLALGVVPVGMAEANFGDDNDDGILPWVDEKLDELGGEPPVLFDENDGIDFEAVADTQPDVILASYSGLTQEDYDTLSDIAPVVAYPEGPWATSWRDIIRLNSQAIGLADEGDELIAELEQEISDVVAEYPQLEGKSAMFMTHVDPTDVSEVGFYTTHDTRTLFFEDLGLETPGSIAELSADTDQFSLTQSTEQIDAFDDVDIITGYGDDTGELLEILQSDPLLSKMPAVERDSVFLLPGSSPLATAANPTPLSISWVLDDYVAALAEAADKVQ